MRRLLLVTLLVFGVWATPAHANHDTTLLALPETLTTEHFVVHFTSDITQDNGAHTIVRQHAGEFAAVAEWAYDTYRSWGYPAHVADADGKIDVYVFSFGGELGPAWGDLIAYSSPLSSASQSVGEINVNKTSVRDPQVAAHQVFHMLQMAMYAPAPDWLAQATADWAAFRLREYPGSPVAALPEPDNSLDCNTVFVGWPKVWVQRPCGLTAYEAAAYTRWSFFQYLEDRFGRDTVREVWSRVQAMASPSYDGDDAIAHVLGTKGANLTDVFLDYSVALMTGSLKAANLTGLSPSIYSSTTTGTESGSLAKQRVAVNRLATRYVEFKPPKQGDLPCHPATLTLTVSLPPGAGSKPSFLSKKTGVVTPLALSGGTASISTAWDTCSSDSPGILSLPNPSQTLDARMFVVTGSLAVDTSQVINATTPPPSVALPVTTTSPVAQLPTIAAPTEDPAPSIHVYGPEVLPVSPTARLVRLVVFSSGSGKLQAVFEGKEVGTVTLQAGNNEVRFRLPASARLRLASRSVLELTSLSPAGARGATVTQRVVFQKVKAKTKTKTKRKRSRRR